MAAGDQTTNQSSNALLLFGPLVLSPDASTLHHIREVLVEHEDNTWMINLIRTLPQDCETALSQLPSLHQATGSTVRRSLADVITDFSSAGSFENIIFPLPNAVLVPLAVIAQLAQYANFTRQSQRDLGAAKETLGLCTGLLSAFAVASAHSTVEFRRHAAAAVRLGMLIGLVVDSEDAEAKKGRYRSLSAAWNSEEKYASMLRIMKHFDEAYISVFYDRDRATITTTADTISNLTCQLQNAGLTASEIGLYGRFHSLGNNKSRRILVDHLLDFCNSAAGAVFRLPDAAAIPLATRTNDRHGSLVTQGPLHAHALRSILIEPAMWFETFSAATTQDSLGTSGGRVQIVDFGPRSTVPPSFASTVDVTIGTSISKRIKQDSTGLSDHNRICLDSDIAVVGMACKVPGADTLEDFWDLLLAGQSQHRELNGQSSAGAPERRFNFDDTPFRSAAAGDNGNTERRRRWFANLVDGHDQFDHRFFKKSARESASMDPQQRHILQVAYQAVEQSGYFNKPGRSRESYGTPKDIGCFVGVCLGDYDNNVASHPANAFTATGNLQGFVSGKVSHFFGWTGPAVTINTACSSSLVAVHQAAQAILSGECEAALAGGTHIMTSATWFQNLAGGSFLSPTGPCKPFDARADGYCRGEGVGAVYLKKMSTAMADGDVILGVVAATGVQQNQNCTPIFVPNGPSLESLFTQVMAKAHIKPSDISVVEAHGTGTAVGDPAEYDGIRKALGGTVHRGPDKPLMVSSVKGLVGHMECASGIISLIKILLMLNKGTLPPQANFETINPALHATPADSMFIPTQPEPWVVPRGGFRAALINNYGASGSNASAVIVQPPSPGPKFETAVVPAGVKYPFWLTAFDKKSLGRYVGALRRCIGKTARAPSLASLSFNLAYQSNRTLDASLVTTARSIGELDQTLAAYEKDRDASISTPSSISSRASPTVVFCFGGQVSSHVGLDRQMYESIAILRHHLDRVDAVVQSLGYPSIFPGIFDRTPPSDIDTIKLHTMLFAVQYSCAWCWMDSGLKPTALVGHSFGTLTALCISGILSLEDTIKIIVRRAVLVKDAWGPDKGAMMAVEGDLHSVQQLLDDANKKHAEKPATIACYNGPTSFTLAGPTAAMDSVSAHLEIDGRIKGISRAKRLHVTNAFHSVLVDPLREELVRAIAGSGVVFRKPTISIELTTEKPTSAGDLTPHFVAEHMREPVYFHQAVERLARQYAGGSSAPQSLPTCAFLEAGTNSTITTMAARALTNVNLGIRASSISFHGVNIANCDDGWNKLTDTTVALWKAGVRVQHWAHHGTQARYQTEIRPLFVPPYQFDPESRHWMDLKVAPKALPALPLEDARSRTLEDKEPDSLLTFLGFQDGVERRQAMFRVNTSLEQYKQLLRGHLTLQTTPILSATLQIGLVIEAVLSINHEYEASTCQPQIQDIEYQSPICFNSTRALWIEVTKASVAPQTCGSWYFEVFSTTHDSQTTRMLHTKGHVTFKTLEDADLRRQLIRYERLFSHARALGLLQNTTSAPADDILGSGIIYRVFSDIVDYGAEFRGLQKMACRGNETAGHVVRVKNRNATSSVGPCFDPHLADTFCQLGGLWANCMMTERSKSHVYLANGIEQWIRRHPPSTDEAETRPEAFDVFAVHHQASEQLLLTDLFVFDATNGALVEVILGVAYVKIARSSMEKLLVRLTEPSWVAAGKAASSPISTSGTQGPLQPPSASMNVKIANAADEIPCTTPEMSTSDVNQCKKAIHSQVTSAIESSKPTEPARELRDLIAKVKAVIADLSGLDITEIKDDSDLADLGIDSLAGMEMRHEIESTLKVELPESEILSVVDLPGLLKCVAGAAGLNMTETSVSTAHAQPKTLHGPRQTDEFIQSSDSEVPSAASSTSDGEAVPTNTSNLSTPLPETVSDADQNEGQPFLSFDKVQEAFSQTKKQTDSRITEIGEARYSFAVLPLQNELAVLLTIETLDALGAGLRTASPGEQLARIPHAKEHERFVTYMYKQLETATQIIKIDGHGPQAVITRTAVPLSNKSSRVLREEMLQSHPEQAGTVELISYAGEHLARVLTGETDGVKVIFGSKRGQELVSQWYSEWPLNRVLIAQMEEFFTQLVVKLQQSQHGNPCSMTNGDVLFSDMNPLHIMEMGAGTGGTTKRLVPLLARLGLPVVYTFTDLSPSFVAAARKRWGKQYPWMQFRVHDIENTPSATANPKEAMQQQHFVIASNAIHATKSLRVSTGNVRKFLREDGFLVMMEMTRTPYWVDLIFGLFEGWWQFEDGREHALVHEARWKEELFAAGYGYVDWTDGETAESEIQKIILAAASSDSRCERAPSQVNLRHQLDNAAAYEIAPATLANKAREQMVVNYVSDLTKGFHQAMAQKSDVEPSRPIRIVQAAVHEKCVLITGGTGGLGSHLVAEAALRTDVSRVLCLNRPSKKQDAWARQLQALHKKGIHLPPDALAKVAVFETDLSQPSNLGLSDNDYDLLVDNVTHIIHNAWLMHSKWPVQRFVPQLRIMAHMLQLAAHVGARHHHRRVVSFAFISSIATVGYHPLHNHGSPVVPEARVSIDSVLPTGYGEAKYICERMLDDTLHRYPTKFRATAVRVGQIAGSRLNGHWNPMEHVSFLLKSSQTIGALPDLPGTMGWTPADDIARAMVEIVMHTDDDNNNNAALYPIYHIENPIRQPWADTLAVLAEEMGISPQRGPPIVADNDNGNDARGRDITIPFQKWLQCVREWPRREDNTPEGANPAYLMVDFLEKHFQRMSCGGLLMGTANAREHSSTLATMGPVSEHLIRLFVQGWKSTGFLS